MSFILKLFCISSSLLSLITLSILPYFSSKDIKDTLELSSLYGSICFGWSDSNTSAIAMFASYWAKSYFPRFVSLLLFILFLYIYCYLLKNKQFKNDKLYKL